MLDFAQTLLSLVFNTISSIKFQIQFEYCNGRSLADDLTDRVKRKRGGMNTDEIVLLLQHCGRGLSYIHSQQLGIGSFRALLSQ